LATACSLHELWIFQVTTTKSYQAFTVPAIGSKFGAQCKQNVCVVQYWHVTQVSMIITINVSFLKGQKISFCSWAKHIMGHFERFFVGAESFLIPKLLWARRRAILGQKGWGPIKNLKK
jgi:hypothetical protein